jgi:prevent-host-death family protein
MRHLPISEARRTLPDLVESPEGIVITKHGVPTAVVLDWHRYQAMRADIELLLDPDRERILAEHEAFQMASEDDDAVVIEPRIASAEG